MCQEARYPVLNISGQVLVTRDMEDRVIHDIMDSLILPQGRYTENFLSEMGSQEVEYLEDFEDS